VSRQLVKHVTAAVRGTVQMQSYCRVDIAQVLHSVETNRICKQYSRYVIKIVESGCIVIHLLGITSASEGFCISQL